MELPQEVVVKTSPGRHDIFQSVVIFEGRGRHRRSLVATVSEVVREKGFEIDVAVGFLGRRQSFVTLRLASIGGFVDGCLLLACRLVGLLRRFSGGVAEVFLDLLHLEHRVFENLLSEGLFELQARQLQQLDRLLQRRRHHQPLRQFQSQFLFEGHGVTNPHRQAASIRFSGAGRCATRQPRGGSKPEFLTEVDSTNVPVF